jgi:hypothetical protein
MSDVEKKMGGKVSFIYINVADDTERAFGEKLGNTKQTTLQFRDKNGKLINQISGVQTPEYIQAELQKMLK